MYIKKTNTKGDFYLSNESKIMIGQRLKKLLEDNGFKVTKDSLVEELGFNPSTLQKYLNDIRRPTLEDIVKIVNELNTSVDYLVGNSDYVLDTWDHKFLDEFFKFASEKIEDHFEMRYRLNISEKAQHDKVLYGILETMFNEEFNKTFEDLTTEEKASRADIYDSIIAIFLSVVTLAKSQVSRNKGELQALLLKLTEAIDGEYSFNDAVTLDELESQDHKTNEEKIRLLKSYIGINVANGQKALRMLEELYEND
jgi:transcriptional regulator with XRE-family HTH domain